jgi:SAM-dependent methyltransferase
VCSASYHHFDDIAKMTNLLATYVKPGGSLLVADILKEPRPEGEPALLEKYKDVVAHPDGFSDEEMRAVFEGAGLTDFEFVNATKATVHSRDANIFLAKGSPVSA